jgi:dihydroorotate dehydrogenase
MSLFYKTGTALLRALPAETAHNVTIKALSLGLGAGLGAKTRAPDELLKTEIGGLSLASPVGLAAGFDKNAHVPDAMLRAGFGFAECGTVTPRPQAGNPKPRLFRLTEDAAVINRMGFNNGGLEAYAKRLEARAGRGGIVGANIGANKDSKDRIGDYVLGLTRLWGTPDYITVNISSPNTPGLRELQGAGEMDELLSRIAETRQALSTGGIQTPIFLKVAPDLESAQIERITEQALRYKMDALIISNTTLARPDSLASRHKSETGGLSGAPLFEASTKILSEFARASAGRIDLIGVGGISSGAQAYAKIRAGAKAVQLYSALVYKGPKLASEINKDLRARLSAEGFTSLAQAVGAR